MVYLPVQDKAIENTKEEFYDNPEIEAAHVTDKCHLEKYFHDVACLEIDGDHVVALVRTEQCLSIVDEIADERRSEKGKVSEIDDTEMNISIGEDKRQEAGQRQSTAQDEQPHVMVKVA
nr:hypothetical protein [Bacteroides cellulosilyticus]